MVMIYEDDKFRISHTNDGYLVQNTSMKGFNHTHIHNFGTAMKIVDLARKKKCPYSLPRYLLISLYRISEDEKYKDKIEQILNVPKKDTYYNRPFRR